MFSVDLFVFIYNSQKLETTQKSSTAKWINKLWSVYAMNYYATIKRKYWYIKNMLRLEITTLIEIG